MERSLILLKPDCLQRGLIGKVITRFEEKGLKIAGMKMAVFDGPTCDEHYSHLTDKPFFQNLKKFILSSPVVCIVVEGKDAVDVVRKMCGVTNSREAEPGTIRGDFSMSLQCNIVHASDSKERAEKEIGIFFKKDEIFSYGLVLGNVLYSPDEK